MILSEVGPKMLEKVTYQTGKKGTIHMFCEKHAGGDTHA